MSTRATRSRASTWLVPGGNSNTSPESKGFAKRTGAGSVVVALSAVAGAVGVACGAGSPAGVGAGWIAGGGASAGLVALPDASDGSQ